MSEGEKKVVEQALSSGAIKVLCATTTLAEGVNLPVRRVIIRDMQLGSDAYIDPLRYQQMAGRAGRVGYESAGDVYLLLHAREGDPGRRRAIKLMTDAIPDVTSKLSAVARSKTQTQRTELEAAANAFGMLLNPRNCLRGSENESQGP